VVLISSASGPASGPTSGSCSYGDKYFSLWDGHRVISHGARPACLGSPVRRVFLFRRVLLSPGYSGYVVLISSFQSFRFIFHLLKGTTSSLPHVCDKMAYGGMFSPSNSSNLKVAEFSRRMLWVLTQEGLGIHGNDDMKMAWIVLTTCEEKMGIIGGVMPQAPFPGTLPLK
jgi:hypothetical protein